MMYIVYVLYIRQVTLYILYTHTHICRYVIEEVPRPVGNKTDVYVFRN